MANTKSEQSDTDDNRQESREVSEQKQIESRGGRSWTLGESWSLNPMWVEWLMGYPAGHTDLKDWETLSSRKSQKK